MEFQWIGILIILDLTEITGFRHNIFQRNFFRNM